MAAAVLLPTALFSAVAAALLLEAGRLSAQEGVYHSVKLASLAIDHELAGAENALRVMASSEDLAAGDLPGFHKQVSKLRTATSWVLVRDAAGKVLLTTRLPYGAAPRTLADARRVQEVLAASGAVVSDVFPSPATGGPIVTLSIAVQADQGPYVLSQVFTPGHFDRILAAANFPADWMVRLFDRQGATIARTSATPLSTGDAGDRAVMDAAHLQALGELHHSLGDDVDVFDVYARSPRSGWTLAAGVPAWKIAGPAQRAVFLAGLGLAATLCVGVWLALANGRRLAGAVSRAATRAGLIGHAGAEPPAEERLMEIDSLHQAMWRAHLQLLQEKDARAAAEADRAALYQREQAARAVAEAQNRGKDIFLAMLGHELRNPLSAITGAVEVIRLRGGDPTATFHANGVIARQSAQLARIVDDLLDVSRIIGGKIRLELEPVELAAKVRRVLATLEQAGRGRQHGVELRLEEAWTTADPTRIYQVIENLLDNAFKYTPEGGTITITVKSIDTEVMLTVQDTGVGIEPTLLPDVFGIFVQGAPSIDRRHGGLGLGLALVRQLVALHEGRVTAQSAGAGRGSTFTVRLPRAEAPPPAPAEAPSPFRHRLRVLVVEDHADARDMLSDMLMLSGHECVTASDGADALLQAAAARPDAAVIDIGLPVLSGYELAARLRAEPSTHDIYLVALTGYGQQNDRQRALDAGFDTHLAKPVNPAMLLKVLDAVEPRQ